MKIRFNKKLEEMISFSKRYLVAVLDKYCVLIQILRNIPYVGVSGAEAVTRMILPISCP